MQTVSYRKYLGLSLLVGVLALGGCRNEDVGGLIGGILGGTIGAEVGRGDGRVIATSVGTMIGSQIGRNIGRRFDERQQYEISRNANHAFEYNRNGEPEVWHDPNENLVVSTTPTATLEQQDGRYCREYTTSIRVNNEIEQGYGTACRQPDGSWQIIS